MPKVDERLARGALVMLRDERMAVDAVLCARVSGLTVCK